MWQVIQCYSDIFIKIWKENKDDSKNLSFVFYYISMLVISCFFIAFMKIIIGIGALRQFRQMHVDMVTALIKAPISLYFTRISKEMVLNRLQSDLIELEWFAFDGIAETFTNISGFFSSFFLSVYFMPTSIVFFPFIVLGGCAIVYFWLPFIREEKRLIGVVRSPVLSLVSESIDGAANIKAFCLDAYQQTKMFSRLDDIFRVYTIFYGANTFFILLTECFSWCFYLFLFGYFGLFKTSFDATAVGLLIINADRLDSSFFSLIIFAANIQYFSVNLERCLEYVHLKPEQDIGKCPKKWPSEGKINFNEYSTKYPEGNDILKNLNFSVEGGEKVAIVGRSGSGKSTFCLGLLRVLEASSGSISVDGIKISEVNLRKLRSEISVIPQNPTLIGDTLRFNIDPLEKHTNEQILEVIRKIGLEESVKDRGGLDMIVYG